MKKIFLQIIPVLLITGIMIFTGCSIPLQKSGNDGASKQSVSKQQASIEDLQYALGSNTYIVAIAAGYEHSLAIDNQGRLWATGDNSFGQLGLGNTVSYVNEWTQVPIDKVTAVSCGYQYSLILRDCRAYGGTFGEVWATGLNDFGQLGLDDTVNRTIWTRTPACYVSAIAAGSCHSLALSGGNIWATGLNGSGQLGRPQPAVGIDELHNWTLTLMGSPTPVSAIACGADHSLALIGGQVWATGNNSNGQLGLGDRNSRWGWTKTPACYVSAIACGACHSLVLSSGTVWTTGLNNHGQLGFGDTIDRLGFTQTPACYVSAAACGFYHSLVLSSGTVWTTGLNNHGQLGFGDTIDRLGFTQTPACYVSTAACGAYHSLVLSSGTVRTTGYNSFGQLGQGDREKRYGFTKCP
jgi:alpha-tubulin suppressor-like RCC1 family protein